MKSTPITQKASTKYGSAPATMEVTVDAKGATPARFERMTPLKKNEDLIVGAGAAGQGKSLGSYKINDGSSEKENDEKDKPKVTSTNTTTSTTPDQTVDVKTEKTVIKPPKRTAEGDAAYEAMTPEQRKAADERYRNNPANQETVTEIEQQTIPGSTTTQTQVNQDPIMVDVKADVTNAYSGRLQRRDVKAATKDEFKAENRVDRLKRRQDNMVDSANDRVSRLNRKLNEAKESGNENKAKRIAKRLANAEKEQKDITESAKYKRLGRKKAMFEKRAEAFGNYADQAVEVVGQHRKIGNTVRTGEREMEWSEVGNTTANVEAQKKLRNEMRAGNSTTTQVNTNSNYSQDDIAKAAGQKTSSTPLNMWGKAKQSYGDGKSSFKMRGYMNNK